MTILHVHSNRSTFSELRPVAGDYCRYPRPCPVDDEPLHHMLLNTDISYQPDQVTEDTAFAMCNKPVVDIGLYCEEPMVARGFAPENEINNAIVKKGHVLCVPPQYACYDAWYEVFAFVCENVLSHPALVAPKRS